MTLSKAEKQWLKEHDGHLIASGDPFYPPVDFYENGEHKGYSADLLDLIEGKLGIEFIRKESASWKEAIESAKSKKIDLITAIVRNADRMKYLDFTDTYLRVPTFIITHQKDDSIKSMDDLIGKRVAITDGYSSQLYFEKYYPEIEIVRSINDAEALQMVSVKEVDAAISDLATTSYYVENKIIGNIKVVGETGYIYHNAFATRNDYPILNQLMSRALQEITKEQKDALLDKWITHKFNKYESLKTYLNIALILALLILVLMGVVLAWNHSLRRLVLQRTNELNQMKNRLDTLVKERTEQLNTTLDQLQKSSNEKNKLFSIIAHDLKNSFHALISVSELMISEKSQLTLEEYEDYITSIQDTSRKTYTLLLNLLEWSLSKSGNLTISNEEFNISSVVNDILTQLKTVYQEKEIYVTLKVETEKTQMVETVFDPLQRSNTGKMTIIGSMNDDVMIESDKRRIETILRNLIANAIKFTARKGQVVVSIFEESSRVKVMIKDSGVGIEPHVMDALFGRSSKVSTMGTAGEKGMGLGLILCHEFCNDIKADLSAESTPNQGSTFVLTVPLKGGRTVRHSGFFKFLTNSN